EKLETDSPRGKAQHITTERIVESDLILFCVDLTEEAASHEITAERKRIATNHQSGKQTATIVVGTKADLAFSKLVDCRIGKDIDGDLELLLRRIETELGKSLPESQGDALHRTTLRCRDGLNEALHALKAGIQANEADLGEEITAAELRAAIQSLSAIIGSVHNEDILGEIFGRFCIGK
ncbi:MAG: hypothetical protein AAGG44_15270, partial [Planctomycetota bacterium]